ncbi:MAG: hypothetical protein KDE03_02395 [Rhodobacteraceae bacterium]|nr:hypothetical protein [Paracoccaceae bacterium]
MNAIASVASCHGNGIWETYQNSELDRRLTMSDSLGGTTAYDWDVEDRLLTLTAPWGTVYTFGYDGEGGGSR